MKKFKQQDVIAAWLETHKKTCSSTGRKGRKGKSSTCLSWAQLICRKSGCIIHTALPGPKACINSIGTQNFSWANHPCFDGHKSAPCISRPIAWTRNSLRFGQTAYAVDSGIVMDSHSMLRGRKKHGVYLYEMGKNPSLIPTFCHGIWHQSGRCSFLRVAVKVASCTGMFWSEAPSPHQGIGMNWIDQWWSYKPRRNCVSLYLICITVLWSHDSHLHPIAFLHHLNTEPILMPLQPYISTTQGLR